MIGLTATEREALHKCDNAVARTITVERIKAAARAEGRAEVTAAVEALVKDALRPGNMPPLGHLIAVPIGLIRAALVDPAAAVAQIKAEGARKALLAARDAWQMGEWADAPRRADQVHERLANAQHVTDWLTARADALTTRDPS